tara:strand:+ start:11944 stop:12897 length:954 start_codon:yes stop_codon:yes gene_type:complete
MWLRITDTIPVAGIRGVFAIAGPSTDYISVQVEGTGTGNTLKVYVLGTPLQATVVNSDWVNLTINFMPTVTEVAINGTLVVATPVQFQGVISGYTLGRTNITGTPNYLDKAIVDEIAFFSAPQDPLIIYNNGVPLEYGMNYLNLISSHEVEKSTGAIRAQTIGARYYQTGTTPSAFNWQGLGGNLGGVVELTTETLRSSDSNPLTQMADKYSKYGKGVANIDWDNRTPIGAGNNLEDKANGLMPYPAGGGYSTVGGTNPLVGQQEEPEMTPKVSKAITAGSNGDSTAYPASGGTNSLSGVTDARTVRLFAPLFVKKP